MAAPTQSFKQNFTKKYNDFCEDLRSAFPELESKLVAAKMLPFEERVAKFKEQVLPNAGPMRDASVCPGFVLPDVEITEAIWAEISSNSKEAVQKHLTVLSFITLYDIHKEGENNKEDWAEKLMEDWTTKMGGIDFEDISKKLLESFGSMGAMGGAKGGLGAFAAAAAAKAAAESGEGGANPFGNFKLPEKFLKGHIAKLTEEIVSAFKPEDFSLDKETLEKLEKEPGSAIELLMNIYKNKPHLIQTAMKRIVKRLQEKFQNGSLSPEQIASEAEELMKEFSTNDEFVKMMESFRNTFGMADMENAKRNNREGSARANIVKERLRKKLAEQNAKKAAAAAAASAAAVPQQQKKQEPKPQQQKQADLD
jgi:chemotaxis protein histidine kinase CheA